MNGCINRLVSVGGVSISNSLKRPQGAFKDKGAGDFDGLRRLLSLKNGFYAFESALHVFPIESNMGEVGLIEWNETELWINRYKGHASNAFFFAEDIFGVQFCIYEGGVYSFDPETAVFTFVASDVEGWANAVLDDFECLSGYPLAHDWQVLNGSLPPGKRLVPKIPFVLGGGYAVENLGSMDSVESMRFRAELAIQIIDLPDGASIEMKFES